MKRSNPSYGKVRSTPKRIQHSKKSGTPSASHKVNLNARKRLDAINKAIADNNAQLQSEDEIQMEHYKAAVGSRMPYTPPAVDKPLVLTPVEQAIANWKARQFNQPWWWLSFSYGKKNAGVVVVQGWNFLDAVNQSNKLGLSPASAGVYGEEMSDMWTPRVGEINRLMTQGEAKKVFEGVHRVSEVDLYRGKEGEVKFK